MFIPVWLGCDGRAVHSLTVFQIILDIQSFNVSFCVDDFTAGLLKLNVLYICSYHIGCTTYGDLDTMSVTSELHTMSHDFSGSKGHRKGGWMGLMCHNSNKLQHLINKMFSV